MNTDIDRARNYRMNWRKMVTAALENLNNSAIFLDNGGHATTVVVAQ